MLPLLKRALALAARALKFIQSVPLRLGVTRVPRTCYGFVSVGYAGRLPAWCSQAPLAA